MENERGGMMAWEWHTTAKSYGCRPSDLWPPGRRLSKVEAVALDFTVKRAHVRFVDRALRLAAPDGDPSKITAAALRLLALE
jgi:hypothetical protein